MESLVKIAKERYTEIKAETEEQRRLGIYDAKFLAKEGAMWEAKGGVDSEGGDHPRCVVDRISGAVNQIIGDFRQTETNVKIEVDGEGDEKVADILTGIQRDIVRQTLARTAFNSAFYDTVVTGYGGYRVLTRYKKCDMSNEAFKEDQEIYVAPIHSAVSSLYFDSDAIEFDKSDSNFAFLETKISRAAFDRRFPEFKGVAGFAGAVDALGKITVVEYWYRETYIRRLVLMSDGRVLDVNDEAKVLDELRAKGVAVIREKEVEAKRVKMTFLAGSDDQLDDVTDWLGTRIPLIPVYGNVATIEGDTHIWGVTRKAIDAQLIYNYGVSALLEITARTPYDPIWMTRKQASGEEAQLANYSDNASPFAFYSPDPMAPGPPRRTGGVAMQQSLLLLLDRAQSDIYCATNIEPPSLGNVPELKSGKAIQAQQAMGDRGSYVYRDNYLISRLSLSDLLIELIPLVNDTERVIRVMERDETYQNVKINEKIRDTTTGEIVVINDLRVGKYRSVAVQGPVFHTRKEETRAQLINLAKSSPATEELFLDLILDNMDLNKGEEAKKRVRTYLIKKGSVTPTPEEVQELGLDQQPAPNPMDGALLDNLKAQTEKLLIGNEKIISEVRNKDADTQAKIISAQRESVKAMTELMEAMFKKFEKGVPVNATDIDLLKGQQALVEETQGDAIAGGELAESAPIGKPLLEGFKNE